MFLSCGATIGGKCCWAFLDEHSGGGIRETGPFFFSKKSTMPTVGRYHSCSTLVGVCGRGLVEKHTKSDLLSTHSRLDCLHLTVTVTERLHNTVSNTHSRIESVLHSKHPNTYLDYDIPEEALRSLVWVSNSFKVTARDKKSSSRT